MRLKAHPQNPQNRVIHKAADFIANGEVVIVPTDTVYAFATSLNSKSGIEKLYELKDMPVKKPLTLYCKDFAQASEYVRIEDNRVFRWMKANLPGPYTLIFQANKNLPQYTLTKQKTVGIRVIDHPVILALHKQLDMPIIGTSLPPLNSEVMDPDEIEEKYGKQVAAIVDCGPLEYAPSTILEAQDFPFEVVREGKGPIEAQ